MPIVSLSLGENLLGKFDRKLKEKGYSGRSEALRELIRTYVSEQDWAASSGKCVVVVNVLYDKVAPRDAVSRIQHEHEELIQTSLHAHFDDDCCMEVFIAKGSAKKLKKLIERIKTVKGVRQVKYITSASGV
jgi:CopG family nickel-responsive transcriptional regulator